MGERAQTGAMTGEFDPSSLCVRDLMTANPATVDEGLSVADAQDRMFHDKIRHLLVTRGNKEITGVVSQRDLAVAGAVASDGRVVDAMTKNPYTVAPDASLLDVVTAMEKGRFGCAVVVENDKPTGMFTTTDALRAVRSLLTGAVQEPFRPAEHEQVEAGTREKIAHHTTAGGAAGRGGRPSPNQGKIG